MGKGLIKISEIDILYEDNHLLCVNKPAGMLSQSDPSGDQDLLTLCRDYIKVSKQKPGEAYLGLVHRLDRAVSGPIVFARTSKAAARLSEQFRNHKVDKTYHAAVPGIPSPPSGELFDFLLKDKGRKMAKLALPTSPGAVPARLHYETVHTIQVSKTRFKRLYHPLPGDEFLNEDEGQPNFFTLMKIQLFTGRFHQIRFQLAHHGMPILGDFKYGGAALRLRHREMALEAYRLEFQHPVKDERIILMGPGKLLAMFQSLAEKSSDRG